MEISKNFTKGVMNKDLDDRLVPDGVYRDALNIKVSSSDDQDSGTVQNYFGNTSVLNVNDLLTAGGFSSQGDNLFPIGSFVDTKNNRIYWFLTSPTYDIIARYTELDNGVGSGDLVLVETRSTGIMKFTREFLITGVNIVENLLFFTDGTNPPRRIDVRKTYRDANISDDSVNVILRPPIASPEISLIYDPTVPENAIEDKFIRFAYRYRYVNNEISAMSPFSKTAFQAQQFKFDFNTGRNESMRNKANSVNIVVDLGSREVSKVEILMRDSRSNNIVIVTSIDKSTIDPSATSFTYNFKNDKVYAILPSSQVTRLFDNVPLSARAQDIIGSRIVYGNYKQFFDIKKISGEDIVMDFSVAKKSTQIISGQPAETIKSGRAYEVGISYLDSFGRMTTVLESPDNTAIIPITNAANKNQLEVTIKNRAPVFASKYRFFIKQNRGTYYNLLPISFYKEGVFVYFQIAKYDIDKVKAGDYIYIKSGPSGPGADPRKYKVLEAEQKRQNFLGEQRETGQEEGFYIKIKSDNSVFDENSFVTFEDRGRGYNGYGGISKGARNGFWARNPIQYTGTYVDKPIFYGTGSPQLSVVTKSAGYTFNTDRRFVVEVTGARTFSYRDYRNSYYYEQNVTMNSELIPTPSGSTLGNSLKINIGGVTYVFAYIIFEVPGLSNYNIGDSWRVNYRGSKYSINGSPINFENKYGLDGPYAGIPFRGSDLFNNQGDLPIVPGSIIKFQINEGYDQPEQRFVSSGSYENIEEWFFEEGIYEKFKQLMTDGKSDGSKTVFFRRGILFPNSDYPSLADVGHPSGYIVMFIKGYSSSNDGNFEETKRRAIYLNFSIKSPSNITILETEGVSNNDAIYYETPKSYPIVNGLHKKILSTDQDQTGASPARITIEEFNAISFGNGMESSIIEDDWNGPQLLPSPRASAAIDRYQQVIADNFLTYSGVFNESSSTNNLNEFNLSLANFKQLEKEFGPIQKLYSRAGDLLVFQEDKISKVLFGKNLIVDSAGGGVVASIPEVLGTQIPYVAEFGISNNPESFAKWSSDIYFTDQKRGAVLSISGDSISVISSYGMKNWFRDLFDASPNTQKLGCYDPFEFKYVLAANNTSIEKCELSVSNDEIVVSGDAFSGGFLFNIKSTGPWSLSVANGSWLTLNATSGNGDRVITGTATSNVGAAGPRTATITITYCGGATKQMTITQSNETLKQVVVVTVGDRNNDSLKVAAPSYGFGGDTVDGIRVPIGIGDFQFLDISPDFVGQGYVPDKGDTVSILGDVSFVDADSTPLKPFNPNTGDKMYYLDTNTKYDPSEGEILLSLATPVTPTLSSGSYVGNFTYNATGSYLYLILDYRNRIQAPATLTSVPAPKNTLPESIVIENANQIGNYTLTYSSNSPEIRFTIENSNGAVIADSGFVNAPSSQTFSIKKITAGSDVIKIYNKSFTGTPLYSLSLGTIALTSSSISSAGYATSALACASSGTQTVFHNGAGLSPINGDTIYANSSGSVLFSGGDQYYKSGTLALRVNNSGVVFEVVSCICGESLAPAITQQDINVVEGQEMSFTIQATNNPSSYLVDGPCREFSLFGGNGGAVFSGQDCKTGLYKQIFVSSGETIEVCFFVDSVTKVAGASDATLLDIGGCSQSLPSGLVFEPSTGTIFGTPDVSGNFTFTVSASNCIGSSPAVTFNINVQPSVEPSKEFYIDNTNSQSTSAAACSLVATYTAMYHDGILSYPVIRDIIYEDESSLNRFDGGNLWYRMQNGVSVKIGDDGVVDDTFLCNINPPTPPAPSGNVMLSPGATSSLACASSSFSSFYYTGSLGVNPGKLYTDSSLLTLAAAAWYKYEVEAEVFISLEWDGNEWTGMGVDCATI